MINYRAVFEKKERAVYISHLDLNRCMQRAFRRSKLPIWFTEGFNPHAYIMFALALSLGFESKCEVMDFRLNEKISYEEVKQRLNDALPPDIRIISVSEPVRKHTEIGFADFEVTMYSNTPETLKENFNDFMNQDKIIAYKRNKKKEMIETDIKPLVEVRNISTTDKAVSILLRLPAGTQKNYNPSLLTDLFNEKHGSEIKYMKTERKKIICADGKEFL